MARKYFNWTAKDVDKIKADSRPRKEIAAEWKCSVGTIAAIKENRVKPYKFRLNYTDELKEAMRKDYESGLRQKDICIKYSASPSAVCAIVNNVNYYEERKAKK